MIGRTHDDDALAPIEAVELLQQRIDDAIVLRLREPAVRGGRATADAIHLVDEDHARGMLVRELEQPLHAADADTHEFVGEIAAGHGDEARAALAGERTRQHRFAGTWIAFQDHAARRARAQTGEARRLLQVSHDILKRLFGFLHADHVVETRVRLGVDAKLLGTAQHVTHHEEQDDEDRQLKQQW
jgi:hypothetical protein